MPEPKQSTETAAFISRDPNYVAVLWDGTEAHFKGGKFTASSFAQISRLIQHAKLGTDFGFDPTDKFWKTAADHFGDYTIKKGMLR